MVFDEMLLDDGEAMRRSGAADRLRAIAGAGARLRAAVRAAEEGGLAALRPEGRPTTVLVAGDVPAARTVADTLAALATPSLQVLHLEPEPAAPPHPPTEPRWTLPGWAGAMQLLLVLSPHGDSDGLHALVDRAYARGCATVAVTRPGTDLARAVEWARGLTLPFVPQPGEPAPGTNDQHADTADATTAAAADPAAGTDLWALLGPALALAHRVGVLAAPPEALDGAAARLDEIATRCRPDAATWDNPAKTLAVELAGSVPLLWAAGPAAVPAAHRLATLLADQAAIPALAARLPEALTAHRGLLHGPRAARTGASGGAAAAADAEADFFRDRVTEPDRPAPHVVLLDPAGETATEEDAPNAIGPLARRHAEAAGAPIDVLTAAPGHPLERLAELLALAEFTATYAGIGTGS
ncbi:SIS domain-containing protein [Allostreptomyces psammosilenae]|uniref:Bifunctional glucose-6-phosphate/mannose-6-phosphate isomerase C-terminal domain-containing protein n=1 Tax=Allostreptomyces psammosilenae TaxID=1892865 RepID=A0A852ZY45_9ACTN|nr:SIS domain-containing protein [Allostreptomyces psammosilenae]NYI06160.1 hypothetical protein [Allostreptomyces psammosilenae]